MASPPSPSVRPSSTSGGWFVDDKRFYQYSHALLSELEAVAVEVKAQWPKPPSEAVKQQEASPDLWRLARRRDMLSDSVKVYSAMSVEAFLNFYGVVRLGQAYFDANIERLGPVAKLKRLFLLCESTNLTNADPLVVLLDRIAKRRNRLVHPRTVEIDTQASSVSGIGDKMPEVAREAVADMIAFFEEFARRDPDISHHMPTSADRDA
jgi:hypothetical protein